MLVGVLSFMPQLLVYVREKYKNLIFESLHCLRIQAARSNVRRLYSLDM